MTKTTLVKSCMPAQNVKGILAESTFKTTQIHPLWWKATYLLNVWQGFLTQGEFEKPWIDPYCRKATYLLKMLSTFSLTTSLITHDFMHTVTLSCDTWGILTEGGTIHVFSNYSYMTCLNWNMAYPILVPVMYLQVSSVLKGLVTFGTSISLSFLRQLMLF